MQQKTFFILIGILLVLGGVWGALVWRQQREPGGTGGLFAAPEIPLIDQVSMNQGTTTTTLILKDLQWAVDGYPADSEKIQQLLDRSAAVRLTELVSKNPQNHSRFSVDDGKGIRVILKKGDFLVVDFLVGSGRSETYVRQKDDMQVFRTTPDFITLFSLPVTDWRNKVLFSVAESDIQKIVITRPGVRKAPSTILTLSHIENGAWRAEDQSGSATTTDPFVMTSFFNGINPLKADWFIETPADLTVFQKEQKVSLILTGARGTVADVSFLEQSKDSVWWAQVGGVGTIFAIPSYRLTDILLTHEVVFGK